MKARRRFRWGVCLNCHEWPIEGCLCVYCLRAAVVSALIPVVIGAIVEAVMRWLR